MEAEPTSSSTATPTAAGTHTKTTRSSHYSQHKRRRRRLPPEQTSLVLAPASEILALEPEEPLLSDFTPRGHPRRQAAVQANVQRRSVFSSSPPPELASKAGPSQRASPQLSVSASSSDITDTDVEEALAKIRKSSRGSSRKSTRSARTSGHSRSKLDRTSPSVPPSTSHSSAADPDVELLEEEEEEEEEPFPESWMDISMSVAIPGRRQAIAKKTGKKCPPQPFHAKHLAGRVSGIYTAPEHGASDFFGHDFVKVQRHARNAHIYLAKLPGEVRRTVRTFLSDVQWKILAFYLDCLWKTYGQRVANPTE